jgi:MraZ protein
MNPSGIKMVESGKRWGAVLQGEYNHNIDEKGRLIVPAKFRNELGESYMICRGMDGNLLMYSIVEWNKFVTKLDKLPRMNANARKLRRHFLGSAHEGSFDKQGRVLVPQALRTFANLDKELVLLGMQDNVEIWNKGIREAEEITKEEFYEISESMEEMENFF